jgi:hypothetical protein
MAQALLAVFAVLSPLLAVLVSILFQRRYSAYDARHQLFMNLMTHRRATVPATEWVNALNCLDVVYSGYPKVLKSWKALYEVLLVQPLIVESLNTKTVELLDEMAKSLGYKSLRQLDIQKFYTPIAHEAQNALVGTSQILLAEVLKKWEIQLSKETGLPSINSPTEPKPPAA